MANSAFGLAAFAAAAAGGVALGYLGERKIVKGPSAFDGPLAHPASGEQIDVVSPDGTRLAAQVSGPVKGPHILLVHGMALGHEVWHYQRLALQNSHRVITFDLRGHGSSAAGADGDYAAGALAADVVAVLQHLVPPDRRVIMVGHSLGGMSLLAALRHHPEIMRDRVAAVGLLSTAGGDVLGSLLRNAAAVSMSMVQSAVVQSPPARWLRNRMDSPRRDRVTDMSFLITRLFGLSASAPPDAVEFVDRLNRRMPAAVLGALTQTLTTIDELDLLAGVRVPVLVLVGDQDRLTPVTQAERLAQQVEDVEFVLVDDAGHTPMVEQPDAVTSAVLRLVDRALAVRRPGPLPGPGADAGRPAPPVRDGVQGDGTDGEQQAESA